MTGRQGRRRRKLLDDLKERRGYSHLKEEALDRTKWTARFGRGFGPVVRQTTKWMKECSNSVNFWCYISALKLIFCTGSAYVNTQEQHQFETSHELISLHVQHIHFGEPFATVKSGRQVKYLTKTLCTGNKYAKCKVGYSLPSEKHTQNHVNPEASRLLGYLRYKVPEVSDKLATSIYKVFLDYPKEGASFSRTSVNYLPIHTASHPRQDWLFMHTVLGTSNNSTLTFKNRASYI